MRGLFDYLHRLLLGLWIGGLLCFGAAVAPALFQALAPGQAAAVVQLVFPRLDAFTVAAGFALLGLGLALEGRPRGAGLWRQGLVLGMTVLACASAFAVTPRMARLRAQAHGSLSDLPKDDPIRRQFGQLHGASSTLLLGQLLLGLGALALPLRRQDAAGRAPVPPRASASG